MKTLSHFWQYLAELFVEWKMFQTKVVEKNTHFMFNNFCFLNRAVYNVEKYCGARETVDNMMQARFMMDK